MGNFFTKLTLPKKNILVCFANNASIKNDYYKKLIPNDLPYLSNSDIYFVGEYVDFTIDRNENHHYISSSIEDFVSNVNYRHLSFDLIIVESFDIWNNFIFYEHRAVNSLYLTFKYLITERLRFQGSIVCNLELNCEHKIKKQKDKLLTRLPMNKLETPIWWEHLSSANRKNFKSIGWSKHLWNNKIYPIIYCRDWSDLSKNEKKILKEIHGENLKNKFRKEISLDVTRNQYTIIPLEERNKYCYDFLDHVYPKKEIYINKIRVVYQYVKKVMYDIKPSYFNSFYGLNEDLTVKNENIFETLQNKRKFDLQNNTKNKRQKIDSL